MTNNDNSEKSVFDGHNRRKKARRVEKNRGDDSRGGLDNPIRRKNPGRRAFDRLLHALHLLNQTLKK